MAPSTAFRNLAMSLIVFIPFDAWTPDGSQFGPGMKRVENVALAHGGDLAIPKAPAIASTTDGPVTGAFVHIFQAEKGTQEAAFRTDDFTPVVNLVGNDGRTADLFELIDETEPDDTDFVICSGAPSGISYAGVFEELVYPGVETGHVVKYRYRIQGGAGAWSIESRLDDLVQNVIDLETVSGSGDTGWVERSVAIDPADIQFPPLVYTTLLVNFEFTVAGSAQFGRPSADTSLDGWTNQAGSATSVYQSIDETASSDSDYAQSPPLQLGGTRRKYRVALSSLTDPFAKDDALGNYTMRYRYKTTNAGVNVKVTLGYGSGAGTVIAAQEHTEITPGSFIAGSLVVNEEIWPLPSSIYSQLWLEFEGHWPTEGTSVATQIALPVADVEVEDGWAPSSGPGIAAAIAATGGAEAVCTVANKSFTVTAPATDPGLDTAHLIRITGRSSAAPSSATGTAELYEGTVFRGGGPFSVTGAASEAVVTIHQSFISGITDYSALRIKVTDTGGTGRLILDRVRLETPEPRRAQISWAEFETPSTAQGQISWARLFVPAAVTEYEGDKPLIYAGTRTKLYEVSSAGFEDLSKAGGYAVGTEEPGGWHFASWGPDVLATNYGDPVQKSSPAGSTFADAITAPSPAPKARLMATWRERLVLGDINLTGHSAAEIWVSAADNYADLAPSASTLAGFQPVRSTAGQVMGLLGGQTGVIAKRNSLTAMLFAGQPLYRLEDISVNVGVAYPRSLVGDAGGFFFHSGGHFYYATVADAPRTIGSEVLSDYVLRTLKPGPYPSMAEEDQAMVGARDPSSGLILWSLRGNDDDAWRHGQALLYNPERDAWALLTQPIDVSFIATNPNSVVEQHKILRGVLGFTYDGTDISWFRFSGATAYPSVFQTKFRELPDPEDTARDETTGRFIQASTRQKRIVRKVIPVISFPEGITPPEPVTTVEGLRDPWPLSGFTVTEADQGVRNSRGEYHFGRGVPGFYHRLTTSLPDGYEGLAKMEGWYVIYDVGGEQ